MPNSDIATDAETTSIVKTETVVVKQDWEVSLSQLRATNEELQRRKADAERDRELFRDLYNKASAHASQVSKENDELLERVDLAEGQVRDGLMMMKKTYDERVSRLESEVTQLKALNAILTAKDVRTQGDVIRRKAALEQELQEENQSLRAELAELRMDYNRMESILEQLGEQEMEDVAEQEEELMERTGVYVPPTPAVDRPPAAGHVLIVEHL